MLKWSVLIGKRLVARFAEERDARGFAKARYGDTARVTQDPEAQEGQRLFRRVIDDAIVMVSATVVGSNGVSYVAITDSWGTYHIRENALSSRDYEA